VLPKKKRKHRNLVSPKKKKETGKGTATISVPCSPPTGAKRTAARRHLLGCCLRRDEKNRCRTHIAGTRPRASTTSATKGRIEAVATSPAPRRLQSKALRRNHSALNGGWSASTTRAWSKRPQWWVIGVYNWGLERAQPPPRRAAALLSHAHPAQVIYSTVFIIPWRHHTYR
jgi:hypothetical protein